MTADHDDARVNEMLAEIRRLRLALTVDLSAAAGALDADDTEVAADIIASAGSASSREHSGRDQPREPNTC